MTMRVTLDRGEWLLGDRIDGGGFCSVLEARSESGEPAAAKLVPKEPGAARELLFADLTGVRNVVPIIDSGETDTHWVLVMPRAEKSLRRHVVEADGTIDVTSAIAVVADVAAALADLDGEVVHRDIKPENVLLLDGRWCLADFGISRYAEAITAPDTRKYSLTPAYAAPERWRDQRATNATDVYSLGVVAYELLAGQVPFRGPAVHDFREQHLTTTPPHLTSAPPLLASLIDECLFKAPQARPTPANLLSRLERAAEHPASAGLASLQEANRVVAIKLAEASSQAAAAQTEEERRDELSNSALTVWNGIPAMLRTTLADAAPAAAVTTAGAEGTWTMRLNDAALQVTAATRTSPSPWNGWTPPAFDVIAYEAIGIQIPADQFGYEGRSHSVWFCDAQAAGEYQ